jgi:hypothetical protein
MQDEPRIELPQEPPEHRRFGFALIVSAAAAVIVLVALFFSPGRQSPPSSAPQRASLPFGPEEQAYARQVRIENIALTRAENFLHQEITTLTAEVVNEGDRGLASVQVAAEFSDELNQVVLRETQLAFPEGAPALNPGQRRSFEMSFEHIPSSWNMQQPAVKVTGLKFPPIK